MATEKNRDRVVVVSYDAASNRFAINPNPVKIYQGQRLYFALQTLNKGDVSEEARFVSLFEDHAWGQAKPWQGCDQLWYVDVQEGDEVGSYAYTVRINYNGEEHRFDPTVLIEPPPTSPPL